MTATRPLGIGGASVGGRPVLWSPFPGFQTRACAATEDEVLIGGAKGPGKSDILLAKPLPQVHKPRFKALIVRHTYAELTELLDRAHRLYLRLAAKPVWQAEHKRFVFPSGASVTFGYLEHLKDCERYQGGEWGFFGYDELGKQRDERVWDTMNAELRSPDPTIQTQAMGSANPGQAGHAWLKRRFIVPCGRDGGRVAVVRHFVPTLGRHVMVRRRFIPGKVTDNPVYANDPAYLAKLHALPERQRAALLHGDWDAAGGLAFEELDAARHFVRRFDIPAHWPVWGGHDWGYRHRWVSFAFASDEDGNWYVVDSVWGRGDSDPAIARTTLEALPILRRAMLTYAGRDVWHQQNARQETTETTAERYQREGWTVTPAMVDRLSGYKRLAELLRWKATPATPERVPQLRFLDTPGNRRVFQQLESLVMDPDRPEDVLKVDASPDSGPDGVDGDDAYDALRYGVASRPARAPSAPLVDRFNINDPSVLEAEAERIRRVPAARTLANRRRPGRIVA